MDPAGVAFIYGPGELGRERVRSRALTIVYFVELNIQGLNYVYM